MVKTYPHDREAFTQGLFYSQGLLFESTGLNGRSSLRSVDLTTGKVLQRYDLPPEFFAEGLAPWGNQIVQLTWKSHIGFVYDRFSFRLLKTFKLPGEGWGITQNGKSLIVSDGSHILRFLDPRTFSETKRLTVTDGGAPVLNLNELEYVHGQIWANVWQSDRIARISPVSGKVLGWIDLAGLMPQAQRPNADAVLNGIAYDVDGDRLFVTGKLWSKVFEIKITRRRVANEADNKVSRR